jgi:hypothetical protein
MNCVYKRTSIFFFSNFSDVRKKNSLPRNGINLHMFPMIGNGFGPGMSSNGLASFHSCGLTCVAAIVLLHLWNTRLPTLRSTGCWPAATNDRLENKPCASISLTHWLHMQMLRNIFGVCASRS